MGDVVPPVGVINAPASSAAAIETPWRTAHFPECGVEDARVAGIDSKIDRARFRTARVNLFPRRPAVHAAIDSALVVRAEEMTERRDVHDVGIVRMYAHHAYVI